MSRSSRGVDSLDNMDNSDTPDVGVSTKLSTGEAKVKGQLEFYAGAMLTMELRRRAERCSCGHHDCTGVSLHIITQISKAVPVPLKRGAPHAREAAIILSTIAYAFGFTTEAMVGPQRRQEVVAARVFYCAILHDQLGFSWTQIGRTLNRDHTTIIHAYNRLAWYRERYSLEWDTIVETMQEAKESVRG
jgi:hypothetical protein